MDNLGNRNRVNVFFGIVLGFIFSLYFFFDCVLTNTHDILFGWLIFGPMVFTLFTFLDWLLLLIVKRFSKKRRLNNGNEC